MNVLILLFADVVITDVPSGVLELLSALNILRS